MKLCTFQFQGHPRWAPTISVKIRLRTHYVFPPTRPSQSGISYIERRSVSNPGSHHRESSALPTELRDGQSSRGKDGSRYILDKEVMTLVDCIAFLRHFHCFHGFIKAYQNHTDFLYHNYFQRSAPFIMVDASWSCDPSRSRYVAPSAELGSLCQYCPLTYHYADLRGRDRDPFIVDLSSFLFVLDDPCCTISFPESGISYRCLSHGISLRPCCVGSDIDVVVIGKWRGSPLEMLKDALVSAGVCNLDAVKVLDKAAVSTRDPGQGSGE